MSLRELLSQHPIVVCIGTGGVGKTTLAAAIALAGARQGRRSVVLTIDPARALGRALGGLELGAGIVRVNLHASVDVAGSLDAGMLDQASAWDAFIRRHAPNATLERTILDNPFYRQLSRSFAGSTEYVAVEELCRLHESGVYDLIVLDTPPAAHALDFVRAPERIDQLLAPDVATLFTQTAGPLQRWIGRLERATGRAAFREMTSFVTRFSELFDAIRRRSAQSRALFTSAMSCFVLVTGPEPEAIAGAQKLAAAMSCLELPLRAVIQNRVHPLSRNAEVAALFQRLATIFPDEPSVDWLRGTWERALATAEREDRFWSELQNTLPESVARARIPELDHDLHSLADLVELSAWLLAR